MSATFISDFRDQQGGGIIMPAQASGTQSSFALTGTSVDLLNTEGPIGVLWSVGLVTGTPDSFIVTYKLQYSKDNSIWSDYVSSGNDTANALANITTASTDVYGLYFHPPVGARYWQALATVSFVNGTSPKVGVFAEIIRTKKQMNMSAGGSQLAVSVT